MMTNWSFSGHAFRMLARHTIALSLSVVLALQPAVLTAQSIEIIAPDNGPRPRLDTAANGTPVLNLDTPNAAGVSHDIFSEFSAEDLILNNSASITSTRLAGIIEGNPNLTTDQAAQLWIGEVIGGSASKLTGVLEVAGTQMDVILANEFGITCDGCGFINTGRTTLTTGAPVMGVDGSLQGFDVREGFVRVGPAGLNPAGRVGLGDTSRVDVIARTAEVYGAMRATELNLITGANSVSYDWSYDPATGAMTGIAPQAGAGAASLLAIDVSALGGMYANAIRMVATEAGVGVRLHGEMASSGDIAISSSGRLTLGAPSNNVTPQIRSNGAVQIAATGLVLLSGAITSEAGALVEISSGEAITADGSIAGGTVVLQAAGLLAINGAIEARQALGLESTGNDLIVGEDTILSGRTLVAEAAAGLRFAGHAAIDSPAIIAAGGDVHIAPSAVLSIEGSASLDAGAGVLVAGRVMAADQINIQAETVLEVTAAGVISGDRVVGQGASVDVAGFINGNSVHLIGDDLTTAARSSIQGYDLLWLEAQNALTHAGQLTSGGDLFVTLSIGDAALIGTVNATQSQIDVAGWIDLADTALLAGQDTLIIRATGLVGGFDLMDENRLRSGGDLALAFSDTDHGLDLKADESILVEGNLTLDLGGAIRNAGMIRTGGDLRLISDGDLINDSGVLKSGGAMSLEAVASFENISGLVEADGPLTIHAVEVVNRYQQVIVTDHAWTAGEGTFNLHYRVCNRRNDGSCNYSLVQSTFDGLVSGLPGTQGASRCGGRGGGDCPSLRITDANGVTRSRPYSGSATITTSSGRSVQAMGDAPMILAGADLILSTGRLFNDGGTLQAKGDGHIDASLKQNTAHLSTRTVSKRQIGWGVQEWESGCASESGCDQHSAPFINVSDAQELGAAPGDVTLVGRVAAGGDLTVAAAVLSNHGDMVSGATDLHNRQIDSPVLGSLPDLPALSFDAKPTLDVAQPILLEAPTLAELIQEGTSTIAETNPAFTDLGRFLSSDAMMDVDRLDYRDELITALRPTPLPEPRAPPAALEFGETAVTAPADGTSTSDGLTITAGIITGSGGRFTGSEDVRIDAVGSIILEGGAIIGGGQVTIEAGGDIDFGALVESFDDGRGTRGVRHDLAAISGSDGISIIADGNASFAGTGFTSGGSVSLEIGEDLLLGAVRNTEFQSIPNGSTSSATSLTTDLVLGGDLDITSGRSATFVGAQIETGGQTSIVGESVAVLAAKDESQVAWVHTSGGWIRQRSESHSHYEARFQSSAIYAEDIVIGSRTGDLILAGPDLSASGDINLVSTEGDVFVGTYTDIVRTSQTRSLGLLGGLLSRSTSSSSLDQITEVTDALAGADLSLVAGRDATLIGSRLEAEGTVSITTGGDLSIEGAISSHQFSEFLSRNGLVLSTTETTRLYEEHVSYASLVGGNIDLSIAGIATAALYARAGEDSPRAEDLLPETLLALSGLEFLNEELAYEYVHDETRALSPAFKALLTIVVTQGIGMVGGGAGLGGSLSSTSWIASAADAFAVNATIGTLDGVVSGEFDPGEILQDAALAALPAGLTDGINLTFPEGSSLQHGLLGLGEGNLSTAAILDAGVDNLFTAGFEAAVHGTDFGDSFLNSMVSSVVSLGLADVQNEIGDLFKGGANSGEGSAGHALLHGLAGCVAAELQSAECAAGAAGGVAQSLYAGTLDGTVLSDKQQRNRAEILGAVIGYVFSGGEAQNVSVAAAVSLSGLANNRQLHRQEAEWVLENASALAEQLGIPSSEAEQLLARELLRRVSDDFHHLEQVSDVSAFIDANAPIGLVVDGQSLFAELDRDSVEYRNSQQNIAQVREFARLYSGLSPYHPIFDGAVDVTYEGQETDWLYYLAAMDSVWIGPNTDGIDWPGRVADSSVLLVQFTRALGNAVSNDAAALDLWAQASYAISANLSLRGNRELALDELNGLTDAEVGAYVLGGEQRLLTLIDAASGTPHGAALRNALTQLGINTRQNFPPNATNSVGGTNIRAVDPSVANAGDRLPPYNPNAPIRDFDADGTTTYVRVYTEGQTGQQGSWMMRQSDIEGLSPQQIQDRFDLPYTPTHVTDVTPPAGTPIRTGTVNEGNFGGNGGGTQFELIGDDYIPIGSFTNPRPLQ